MTRRDSRRDRDDVRSGNDTSGEVQSLRRQVARLERTLAEVIAASDDVVLDLRRTEAELALLQRPAATEWHDEADAAAHRFFDESHLDERARRWLLAPNRRSLRSRMRFGRTANLRPPVLRRLRPAMTMTA